MPNDVPDNNLMTRRARCYGQEIDTWFYYEFDATGRVTRQIELQGPERIPVAAAVREEWIAALRCGTADEYHPVFGATADMPLHVWEDVELEDIAAEEFETVWIKARAACEARARTHSTPEP